LLEYLSNAQLREQFTASTNKVEAYHRFAKWLFFGGEGWLLEIHPDEQEKRLKYNHLLTNAVAIQNVIDLTREAFAFDDPHLWAFFLSGKPWDERTEYACDPDARYPRVVARHGESPPQYPDLDDEDEDEDDDSAETELV